MMPATSAITTFPATNFAKITPKTPDISLQVQHKYIYIIIVNCSIYNKNNYINKFCTRLTYFVTNRQHTTHMSKHTPLLQSQIGSNFIERITIFPLCSVPRKIQLNQYCKRSMLLYDGSNTMCECPVNMGYYMEHKPVSKFQWVPPRYISNMLCGKSNIYINCKASHLKLHRIKTMRVGWINYVHKNNMVYYGTRSGLLSRLQRYEVPLNDTLIDAFNSELVKSAQSCEDKSLEFRQNVDSLGKRAQFVSGLSELLDRYDIDEALSYLSRELTEATQLFGCKNTEYTLNIDEIGLHFQFKHKLDL